MTIIRVLCALLFLGAGVAAQGTAPAQTAPPAIDGKWTLTSEVDRGGPSVLTLAIEGKKATGRLVGPSGDLPLTGEYADSTLTFSVVYDAQITVVFTGKPQQDGSLAGTMEYGQGPKAWTAVRLKE
jgi:hypothetical protein